MRSAARKAVDWLHLLLWMLALCYLFLMTVNRLIFLDHSFYGLNSSRFSEYQDVLFWSGLLAVPLLTVIVVALIGIRRLVAPAEMIVMIAGWGMLLYNLSFVRS